MKEINFTESMIVLWGVGVVMVPIAIIVFKKLQVPYIPYVIYDMLICVFVTWFLYGLNFT